VEQVPQHKACRSGPDDGHLGSMLGSGHDEFTMISLMGIQDL
jgi:hypothetical protein